MTHTPRFSTLGGTVLLGGCRAVADTVALAAWPESSSR